MKLRWAFDYTGKKPTVTGDWNNIDQDEAGGKKPAWRQSKENLKAARIEAEMDDGSVQTLAEVNGADFRNFEWIADATIRVGAVQSVIVGLSLVSKGEVAEIFLNGRARLRKKTKDDQKYEGLK